MWCKKLDCAIVDINAPAAWVWQTLVDAPHYENWSDSFRIVKGDIVKGESITVVPLNGALGFPRYHLQIEEAEEDKILVWSLSLPIGVILKLERSHFVTTLSDSRCQYSSMMALCGLGASTVNPFMHHRLKRHLDDFAQGLKTEAETRYIHHMQTLSSA